MTAMDKWASKGADDDFSDPAPDVHLQAVPSPAADPGYDHAYEEEHAPKKKSAGPSKLARIAIFVGIPIIGIAGYITWLSLQPSKPKRTKAQTVQAIEAAPAFAEDPPPANSTAPIAPVPHSTAIQDTVAAAPTGTVAPSVDHPTELVKPALAGAPMPEAQKITQPPTYVGPESSMSNDSHAKSIAELQAIAAKHSQQIEEILALVKKIQARPVAVAKAPSVKPTVARAPEKPKRDPETKNAIRETTSPVNASTRTKVATPVAPTPAPNENFVLYAVANELAYLRTANGDTMTARVGTTLPGGAVVTKVDDQAYTVTTTAGVIRFRK